MPNVLSIFLLTLPPLKQFSETINFSVRWKYVILKCANIFLVYSNVHKILLKSSSQYDVCDSQSVEWFERPLKSGPVVRMPEAWTLETWPARKILQMHVFTHIKKKKYYKDPEPSTNHFLNAYNKAHEPWCASNPGCSISLLLSPKTRIWLENTKFCIFLKAKG